MITVGIRGGMGNQMLQYAMGRAQAIRLGVDLQLDTTWFDTTCLSEVHWKPYCLDQWAGVIGEKVRVGESSMVISENKNGVYDPELVSRIVDGSVLDGFWHTEKYFSAVRAQLLKDFVPKKLSEHAREVAGQIKEAADCSVFVTVRRGQGWTNILPMSYYLTSAELIAQETDPHFFVFSDDADWIRESFKLPYRMTIAATHPRGSITGCEAEDLWLKSKCKHAILAPSSFSWWGAWLGDPKIVIAPFPWESETAVDVAPDRWLRINCLERLESLENPVPSPSDILPSEDAHGPSETN